MYVSAQVECLIWFFAHFFYLTRLFIFLLLSFKNYLYILCIAKLLQSCPTLCDPIHGSPPGSPVPGILQARTLEWVAISFARCMKMKSESEVAQSCPTLSDPIAAYQAPLSMGFSRQGYWSGVPLPSPIYFIYQSFIKYVFCRYHLPVSDLSDFAYV